jgi:hypothetical protein
MKQFDIYYGEVYYADLTGHIDRPITIISLHDLGTKFDGLPVYTRKRWWKKYPEIHDLIYIIQDWKQAGLKFPSGIDISYSGEFDKTKFSAIDYTGHLSNRDITRVKQAVINYNDIVKHAQQNNPERILIYQQFVEWTKKHPNQPTPGNHHPQYQQRTIQDELKDLGHNDQRTELMIKYNKTKSNKPLETKPKPTQLTRSFDESGLDPLIEQSLYNSDEMNQELGL